MSRVKQKDTDLELIIRSGLRKLGCRFRTNVRDLPGKPDIVFSKAKLAVFIDGDFWHGYRFPLWRHKLKPFWKRKITKNRSRDQQNFRKLRATNWRVIRIWQHQVNSDLDSCLRKILLSVRLRTRECATSQLPLVEASRGPRLNRNGEARQRRAKRLISLGEKLKDSGEQVDTMHGQRIADRALLAKGV
jgi:DNA mismatch endonuclease (patch repair protein)